MSDTFFSGSITALITPMNRDGSLDFPSFENLVDWQIREGTSALCAVGTTGESPTLSHTEHHAVVERAIKVAAGRVPVIAGAGSNSTAEATDLARHAQNAGAAAVLVVAPYYNKPTQEGLYRHFMTIADAISIPVILYNIPGRSVVDISVETMARLAKHANIIGVKDATANLLRPLQLRHALDRPFNQLSGEDGTAVAFLASGGDGCISVTSNVAPALCANVQSAWKEGRVQDAMAIQDRLLPLHDAMFCESNPAPVKYAASLLGLAGETCRLPLAPLTEPSREKVRAALVATGLLD
ncbi:4-hydroxy-tetrahydrodipicolinate synthase [Acetobacter peroxydans]|jgi:4-hydroxy-tetrahydrodipicolinate synthase|uniref:4-hydroxy-tetrahydrodipicolinate synthase n=1 Tax=Acetobacter peroxydans TaxID=104098 RepID=A0A4Y3TNJ0_9PROT|nr:4-hydroxy-tetrahydrodipicolinate synthase [Acetobacter peroxydans]MCH4142685.1 4-hydroxy-tetrahydrodipicolinate synthase [Acetobacter peroxydans]MCI1395847.1 4-hydroxy-tetrahydrodipicolinate synthase [Acetobacter peroxydans]MCI1411071.1 4-hydroxy-tetrahydrodipicolinate synthase [Acetobacter peroxydans]MCI1440678.1 4-hydroxy-tetrahydrodipicolinate synthase [Acetobacter peroxydans]MCI1567127.1 4-hydroxy-tetrahydrodipicolinate synthase [Acetobacter peroxydans]